MHCTLAPSFAGRPPGGVSHAQDANFVAENAIRINRGKFPLHERLA
jgi:hypothetical protein